LGILQNQEKYVKLEKNVISKFIATFHFDFKDYLKLGSMYDLFEIERGGKVSGSKFIYLKNEAVILELALINWALFKIQSKGFTHVITPEIVRNQVAHSCGFSPRDEASQIYNIGDSQSLIGTSEIPIAGKNDKALFSNETFFEKDLPKKFVGFSHCFRKEAGKGESSK